MGRRFRAGLDLGSPTTKSRGPPIIYDYDDEDDDDDHRRIVRDGKGVRAIIFGGEWPNATGSPGQEHQTKGKTMDSEQKQKTAIELLATGWELTEQSMALVGLAIPYYLHFLIDGANQIRVTRVAELDQLAKAIGAIDEDIARLVKGAAALIYRTSDVEQLRQEKAALIELQKRANRSGCSGSTTVIEALFPDIPVKKKTASERAENERWLAIRKAAALSIDPETCEVDWTYGCDMDPYGVYDEWELPEEYRQVGRQQWARSPGSDIWVRPRDRLKLLVNPAFYLAVLENFLRPRQAVGLHTNKKGCAEILRKAV
jgi:hypothetical protein